MVSTSCVQADSEANVHWLRNKTNAIKMKVWNERCYIILPVACQKPRIWTARSYSIASLRVISPICLSVMSQRESH